MGWFDEQIRQRIQHDDDSFSDAFADALLYCSFQKTHNVTSSYVFVFDK